MKSRSGPIALTTLCVCLALTAAWWGQSTGHLAGALAATAGKDGKEDTKPALTVRVGQAHEAIWPLSIVATGLIAPWQEASVGAETGGLRVATLDVDVGTQVHAGDVLATLASESVDAELRRLLAMQASARASLAQARSNAERADVARKGEAIAEQQYNDYQIAVQTAQASLAAVDAQLDAQRVTKAHTRIVAVDDGVISARTVTLGKVVQTGEELFRLIRRNRLEWQAEVDARDLDRIRPGQLARLTLPGGISLTGHVRLAAPGLVSATGRGIVYVSLPASIAVRPGMYANGSLEQASTSALVVPQTAVVVSDGTNYLFEVRPDHHVLRRQVAVGRRLSGQVEIVHGIAATATVVIDGGAFLGDGDLVRISRTDAAS